MKTFGGYSQMRHQKTLMELHFSLFSSFVIQLTCLCFMICCDNRDTLMSFKSFFKKCGFKESSYLNQEQTQMQYFCRQIK